MAEKKILVVLGATGAQGGGVLRASKADPDHPFYVRAITRDKSSERAQAIAGIADEVVEATTDDVSSLERAFAGADAVFAVTNFWDHYSAERETQQARNIAEAAKQAGVKHVVWSTLEDARNWVALDDNRLPTLNGKYKVPHFDGKGEADQYFKELGVPTTYFLVAFYWENMLYFGMNPKPGPDGTLQLSLPIGDHKFPGVAVQDIGKTAYQILKAGEPYIGQTVGIAGDALTGSEMAAVLSDVIGKEIQYNPIRPETYRSFGFPGAEDLGNMFEFNTEIYSLYPDARNIDKTRALNPGTLSFAAWAEQNKDKIPLE